MIRWTQTESSGKVDQFPEEPTAARGSILGSRTDSFRSSLRRAVGIFGVFVPILLAAGRGFAPEPEPTTPLVERLILVAQESKMESKEQLGALWKLFLLGARANVGDLRLERADQRANFATPQYRVRRVDRSHFVVFGRSTSALEIALLTDRVQEGARSTVAEVDVSVEPTVFAFKDPSDGSYLTGSGDRGPRLAVVAQYILDEATAATAGSVGQKEAVYELFLMGSQIPLGDLPASQSERSEMDSYVNPRLYRVDANLLVFMGERPAHRYAAVLKTSRHGFRKRVSRVVDIRVDKDERLRFPFP